MYIVKKFINDIKSYKDLIYHLILSDFKANSARTYLGFLWWIIDPILYMAVFYVLVHIILQRGGPDYPVFLFCALIPLKWTISCIVDSTTAISSKGGIIQQVYVPKFIFILVRLGINTLKFFIGSVMLFFFLFFYGVSFSSYMLFYPVLMLIHMLFLVSIMILMAHIGVFFRDIKNMMQYGTRMLFYLSPVLYSISSVPINLQSLLYINPLTSVIISYRNILLYGQQPTWSYLAVIFVVSMVLLYIGLKLIHTYEKKYAKVI